MIAHKYQSGRGTKRDGDGNDVFVRDLKLLVQDKIYVSKVEQLNDPSEALVDDKIFKTVLVMLKPYDFDYLDSSLIEL